MKTYHPVQRPMRRFGRRQLLRGGVGVAAGTAGSLLLACGGGNNNKQPAKSTASGSTPGPSGGAASATSAARGSTPAPKRGGRINLYYDSSTNSLNPITDSGQRLTLGALHVWDRLVSTRLNKDSAKEYLLEAAQSVELPDPTTVTFKLKPGLTFQDRAPVNGRAVEGDDVVKSQLYVRDEPRAGNNSFQTASMDSVTAPDAQTVTFRLKGPNAYLFSGTQLSDPGAQCIFPKELIGNLDTTWSVGSGPYEMAEYELNKRYLYRRYARYHEAGKGLPYLDEQQYTVIADQAAQEAAFRSGQIDVWTVPNSTIADPLKKDLSGKIALDEYLALSMQTLNANVTKAPWNDMRVREALYRLVNRQQYLDLLEQGKGQVPPGPLPAGLTDYQLDPKQSEPFFRQDAKAAKQLLDAAAFPYDRTFEVSAIDRPRDTQGCQIFQQQVSQVGMKVNIVPMPLAEWLSSRIATGNWELFVAYWPGYDTPQVPLRLQHTQTHHIHKYAGLKDPEVDKLIEQSEVTLDKDARIKLVKDIQLACLQKYTPMIYTENYTVFFARWNYVRDYEISPATLPLYQLGLWLNK